MDGEIVPQNEREREFLDGHRQGYLTGYLLGRWLRSEIEKDQVLSDSHLLFRDKYKNERLASLAFIDDKTGLLNSRGLQKEYDDWVAQLRRHNDPGSGSLFVVDLDHFNQVNDQVGHLGGDLLLKLLATHFQNVLRQTDIIGRYGGDEFVCILPGARGKDAKMIAENLRHEIANVSEIEGEAVQLSATIGACELNPSLSFKQTFDIADKLMMDAKNRDARNTVNWATFTDQR